MSVHRRDRCTRTLPPFLTCFFVTPPPFLFCGLSALHCFFVLVCLSTDVTGALVLSFTLLVFLFCFRFSVCPFFFCLFGFWVCLSADETGALSSQTSQRACESVLRRVRFTLALFSPPFCFHLLLLAFICGLYLLFCARVSVHRRDWYTCLFPPSSFLFFATSLPPPPRCAPLPNHV